MIDIQDTVKKTSNFIRTSVTVKVITIGFLIMILMIPAVMIHGLIFERQHRRDSVLREISQKWGNDQTITGPFITVPFKVFFKDAKGKSQYNINYLNILPETLEIDGEIKPEIRYRSLFEAVLYNANLNLKGNFKLPSVDELNIEKKNILWDKAMLSIGITDMRGIQDNITVDFNGSSYNAKPGLQTTDLADSGVCATLGHLDHDDPNTFSINLNLNGSEQINMMPVGETTTVHIQSSWPSPSFNGAFLPATREISKKGFSADWKILHLNRNYPQFWQAGKHSVKQSAFGLQLIMTADLYQKVTRLAKYAIMFIVLTFVAFFMSEIINKRRVHPIQYLLIGAAVLLFYTLVLSLSEHIHFNLAYALSASAVTLIVSSYARAILRSGKFAATIFVLLGILYTYLFIVLQLEDYALVMGNVGLLVILAVIMYVTRNINWYRTEAE